MKTTTTTYQNDNGLLVSGGTCAGYIFNFTGHGAFAPSGKVQLQNGVLRDLTQGEIDEHNRLLGQAEWEALKKHGRGVLYLTRAPHGTYHVATWAGHGRTPCYGGPQVISQHGRQRRAHRCLVQLGRFDMARGQYRGQ